MEKLVYCGTLLKSFPQTEVAFRKMLGINLGRKRIERITERIRCHRRAVAPTGAACGE